MRAYICESTLSVDSAKDSNEPKAQYPRPRWPKRGSIQGLLQLPSRDLREEGKQQDRSYRCLATGRISCPRFRGRDPRSGGPHRHKLTIFRLGRDCRRAAMPNAPSITATPSSASRCRRRLPFGARASRFRLLTKTICVSRLRTAHAREFSSVYLIGSLPPCTRNADGQERDGFVPAAPAVDVCVGGAAGEPVALCDPVEVLDQKPAAHTANCIDDLPS